MIYWFSVILKLRDLVNAYYCKFCTMSVLFSLSIYLVVLLRFIRFVVGRVSIRFRALDFVRAPCASLPAIRSVRVSLKTFPACRYLLQFYFFNECSFNFCHCVLCFYLANWLNRKDFVKHVWKLMSRLSDSNNLLLFKIYCFAVSSDIKVILYY